MTALTTIAPRLRQLILLLSSSHPGEVTNAAAIGRTLKTAGIDWHAFAAAIEPTIPKAEMQRLSPRDWAH